MNDKIRKSTKAKGEWGELKLVIRSVNGRENPMYFYIFDTNTLAVCLQFYSVSCLDTERNLFEMDIPDIDKEVEDQDVLWHHDDINHLVLLNKL